MLKRIKKAIKKKLALKCDDCGTTENVQETICPYAQEIHDEIIDMNLCDDCLEQRAGDI